MQELMTGLLLTVIGLLGAIVWDTRKKYQEALEKDNIVAQTLREDIISYITFAISNSDIAIEELKIIKSQNELINELITAAPDNRKPIRIANLLPISFTSLKITSLNTPKQLSKLGRLADLQLGYAYLEELNTLIKSRESYYAYHWHNPEVYEGIKEYNLRIITLVEILIKTLKATASKIDSEMLVGTTLITADRRYAEIESYMADKELRKAEIYLADSDGKLHTAEPNMIEKQQ